MKNKRYFNKFLSDHVNLNQTRLDRLTRSLDAVEDLLKKELTGYRKVSKQGSYAHKTIIKPVKDNDEFDADILVFIRDDHFNPGEFKEDYVNLVYQMFKDSGTYEDKVNLNTRCVTIDYADDFHLDVVPCIEHGDTRYICNRKDETYEKTDGDGYKSWLIKKNEIVGGNNLRKTTRLLKFLRDHKDNFRVKSILLTTLLGEQISDADKNSNKFEDLPTTLKTLFNRINDFLQKNSSTPVIKNPVLSEEDFNRHWDFKAYSNFRDKFGVYTRKINEASCEEDPNKSVEKWRKLFGPEFGQLIPNNSGAVTVAATIPPLAATKPYATG